MRASLRCIIVVSAIALLFGAPSVRAEVPTDLVVAAYYPPLMIDTSNAMPGSSIEILRAAAERLGRKLAIEFLPFARALKTLQRRENYLQPALYRNPVRESDYTWIARTHEVEDVFLTIDKPINSVAEARKLGSIGVEQAASMDVFLTRVGFANLTRVDNPEANALRLNAGRIDAWALTRSLAVWTWRRAGIEKKLVIGEAIKKADVYLVGSKSFSPKLKNAYAGAISAMQKDGTIERILEKYR